MRYGNGETEEQPEEEKARQTGYALIFLARDQGPYDKASVGVCTEHVELRLEPETKNTVLCLERVCIHRGIRHRVDRNMAARVCVSVSES